MSKSKRSQVFDLAKEYQGGNTAYAYAYLMGMAFAHLTEDQLDIMIESLEVSIREKEEAK